jgi:hypothetical protein
MSLTKDDKQFLVSLAKIMMNHLAFLIQLGQGRAMHDWNKHTSVSFDEKVSDLLK